VLRAANPEVPIVIATAVGTETLRETPPGAQALLRKPFDVDDLLVAVARHCAPPAA
jgi:CheY-like chemotaxis protein